MSRIRQYTGGLVTCNGYLVEGAPGLFVAIDAPEGMAAWVQRSLPAGGKVTHLLLTHQHFDHVQDAALLQERTGCRIVSQAAYSPVLTLESAAAAWGIPPVPPFRVDDVLGGSSGSAEWAGMEWKYYSIPGHSSDGAAYYWEAEEVLFVGDILFAGSVGRTDFPGGSMAQLVRGIRSHLLPLPPSTAVYSGHGPATSIGEEQLNNPYIC